MPSSAVVYLRFILAGRKCFSCMSRYYGAVWEFAGYERLYLEPRSFSDYCEDPQSRMSDVLPMNCDEDDPPGTNCIMFVEDLKIGACQYLRGGGEARRGLAPPGFVSQSTSSNGR